MQDALKVKFINNTVISNDTTASAGVLFNTLGAPNASTPPPGCTPQPDPTLPQDPSCIDPVKTSTPQAAGLVTMENTPNLKAIMPTGGNVVCPSGNTSGTNGTAARDCSKISYPELRNNVFWQNRAFNIVVGGFGPGEQDQQHLVTLAPALNQPQSPAISNGVVTGGTGACVSGASYWDIGVRGDTGPSNHHSGFTLRPLNSILTSFSSSYSGNGNLAPTSAGMVQQYCNGARVPPEIGGKGYNVPPGGSESTGLRTVFTITNVTPAATVDEGNNWLNMSCGALALANSSSYTGKGVALAPLGNYPITSG